MARTKGTREYPVMGRTRIMKQTRSVTPRFLWSFSEDQSLWHETEKEVEAELARTREKEALLRWVRRAMGRRLTPRERKCIELCFFKGMSYRNAATATRSSGSSVCRAVRRALGKLRQAAREEGVTWSRD